MNRNKGNKTYGVTRILACCFPVKICQWLQTDCGHKNVVVIKIVNCCGHKNCLKNLKKIPFGKVEAGKWRPASAQFSSRSVLKPRRYATVME